MARTTVIWGLALAAAANGQPLTLGTEDASFIMDGRRTFLLGISYYGGLGASDDVLERDLDEMRRRGFNWIRVWATWAAFGHDVSAVDREGRPREEYLGRLKHLVGECDQRGIVVDVTLSRGNSVTGPGRLQSFDAHLRAVQLLAGELRPYRNVYIDVGNERNIRDARYVSKEEVGRLRDAIKAVDPERLVTASHAGDISRDDLEQYLSLAKVDFIAPHRPRHADSPAQTADRTREYVAWMRALAQVVPVHYQEPFRRGFSPGRWDPVAADFLADLLAAEQSGAAGWCLHNGDARGTDEGRPRRSFDLRDGSLFEQLDAEERAFLDSLEERVAAR
jgi:hypothetical protein